MDRFLALTAFVKVVETGSFARAAERLGHDVVNVEHVHAVAARAGHAVAL